MPERTCLRYQLRAPVGGYIYRCVPAGPSSKYYPATRCVFPTWNGSAYSTTDEYRHGSILEGGLSMGQRSVTHSALNGDVVFELPSEPLDGAGDVVQISNSLTFGRTAMFGKWSTSGVLANDGSVQRPYAGIWRDAKLYPTSFCLKSFEYSLPYVRPAGWTIGEVGTKYSNLQLSDQSVSYHMSVRNWQARESPPQGWTTAGGYREEWDVSVTFDGTGCHGRARSTLRESVVAFRGTLVWSAMQALQDNFDFAESKVSKLPSSAVGPSYLRMIAFDCKVQGARLWASKDLYPAERVQAHNDALDSYRALRSNNIENAVQMKEISKLLPLDTARLVPHLRAEPMPGRKALLMAKIVSGLYLWWKYVVTTTYDDLGELLEAIPHLYPKGVVSTLRAGVKAHREYEFPNTTRVAETIRVSPYNLTLLPLRLGVHPGLAQAWDLVPFSFVVDWFMGISNQLNAIDWFIYKTFMKLHYIVSSRKTKVLVDASDFGGAGQVEVSFYVRSVSLAWPGFSDSIPFPRCAPIKNWAAAAVALAISNKKM